MTTSGPTAAIASARRHGVGDLLHRTARRYPGKLAVVAGDLRATYDEFDTAVNRAAHALTDRGLQPGDRLALLSHNCWQFAVVAFATAKETRVVDADGAPVPPGRIGEIVHRSPHAALGYYADEAKTAEAFAGGWFHSGDLGVLDADGYLSVVDRMKDMIKTGGENVAGREVEEAVYQLDGVAEVAVFGISHPYWVEAVVAVVVPRAGVDLTADEVHAHARERLAAFKRPKYVVFADALPKNPSGKILKRELRATYAALAAADG